MLVNLLATIQIVNTCTLASRDGSTIYRYYRHLSNKPHSYGAVTWALALNSYQFLVTRTRSKNLQSIQGD